MPYQYLDDIATADVAFRAWGKTQEEMFIAAADATLHVVLENPEAVRAEEEIFIHLEQDSMEMLLFHFLQELVFSIDAKKIFWKAKHVCILGADQRFFLEAQCQGDPLDRARHHLMVDIKAITLHRFFVRETAQGWEAQVVVDV